MPERPPHTSLLVERRHSDEANRGWEILGGHDGQRPMGEFGQVTPLLFFEGHPVIFFLMTTESQDLGLTSHPKDRGWGSIYFFFRYLSFLMKSMVKGRWGDPRWDYK